jgi:transposase
MTTPPRTAYATDVSDEEWIFLALTREEAPQRQHDLRGVFNGLRYIARAGL